MSGSAKSKESVNARKTEVKHTVPTPPARKNLVLAKKCFSPSKPTTPHINVYVCGLTHGVIVMRTEKSNKKNVEGFVQPLKNKCMEDVEFASSLDIVKVNRDMFMFHSLLRRIYKSH
jgi:hypothetical protein